MANSNQAYEKSGVNVQAGDDLVNWLEKTASESPLIVQGIGGFASLTRIPTAEYIKPLLVSCADGVGTKALLAAQTRKVKGLGQDLVAMNVNDLICTGGDPYYFLDYWASGKLDLELIQDFLKGVKEACAESECLLIGGETAEMPGLYQKSEFDCAGFSTGFVSEEEVWGSHRVSVGSEIWALPSSGFHSNGYSLLRKVFEKDIDQWMDQLLIPTALYVKFVKKLKKQKIKIQAAAHITGSGFDNIARVLPDFTQAQIDPYLWPEVFTEVQNRTQMSDLEMLKTLNCGVGFVLVMNSDEVDKYQSLANSLNQKTWKLGDVVKGESKEPEFVLNPGEFKAKESPAGRVKSHAGDQ
jgi:phosphoribosylformylglycinamidine cyclo-ligase